MRSLTYVFSGISDFEIEVNKVNEQGRGEEFKINSIFNQYHEEIKLENYRIIHSLQEMDDPPTFTVVREIELFQVKYLRAQI